MKYNQNMRKSYYLLSFTIPLSIFISFWERGYLSFFALIYAFALLPFLELFFPILKKNWENDEEEIIKNQRYYDVILWIMVPVQYGLLFWFCYLFEGPLLTTFERIGLMSAMGLGCGVLGINVAHELGHRSGPFEQRLSKLLLLTSLYWHFFIEHNKGHHKNVSTFLDPETSRFNESLYAFYVRSIKGSFISAFHIDPKEMTKALSFELLFLLSLYGFFGQKALLGFMLSAFIGILLLESVNYIEHYGLVRKEISPNRFEKVLPLHSWNSDHILSRAILFDLSRHSDHHSNVGRKYQILRHHNESPTLPTGYPGMILVALIPPLWFRVMNKRVKA
jgi:alkane 1-monooxygenase